MESLVLKFTGLLMTCISLGLGTGFATFYWFSARPPLWQGVILTFLIVVTVGFHVHFYRSLITLFEELSTYRQRCTSNCHQSKELPACFVSELKDFQSKQGKKLDRR